MSLVVRLMCDRCGRLSSEIACRAQDLRVSLYRKGWTGGCLYKPYAGKRADFCPRCGRRT